MRDAFRTIRAAAAIAATLAATQLLPAQPEDAEGESRHYDPGAYEGLQLEIVKTKNPIFPLALRQLGITEGYATFKIFINANSKLEDCLAIEASDVAIAREVERVLPSWLYFVPKLDGERIAIVTTITVTFENSGTVVYQTTGSSILPNWLKIARGQDQFRVYSLSELDSIPEPIHVDKPEFHIDLLEDRDLINAVFEFYIDIEGNVRMPTLRAADDRVDERLLVIAQESLVKWKFNPPTVDRRPVVAKVAQPFRFLRGEQSASLSSR